MRTREYLTADTRSTSSSGLPAWWADIRTETVPSASSPTATHSGVSELAALKRQQVDLKQRQLHVLRLKGGLDSTHHP